MDPIDTLTLSVLPLSLSRSSLTAAEPGANDGSYGAGYRGRLVPERRTTCGQLLSDRCHPVTVWPVSGASCRLVIVRLVPITRQRRRSVTRHDHPIPATWRRHCLQAGVCRGHSTTNGPTDGGRYEQQLRLSDCCAVRLRLPLHDNPWNQGNRILRFLWRTISQPTASDGRGLSRQLFNKVLR